MEKGLNLYHPTWNVSTIIAKDRRPQCSRQNRQNSKFDMPLLGHKYNYRAEVLPFHQSKHFAPSASKHNISIKSFLPEASSGLGATGITSLDTPESSAYNISLTQPASAATISKRVSRYGEMAVNPKLQTACSWDSTSTVMQSQAFKKRSLKYINAKARKNSQKQTPLILMAASNRKDNIRKQYVSPELRYRRSLRERRKQLDGAERDIYLMKLRTGTLNPPPPHKPRLHLETGTKPRKIKVCL